MNSVEIFILSCALALDALVVSFSYGLILEGKKFNNALKFASAFGFFQFIMPVTGYNFTELVYSALEFCSKYIVFAIFAFLGAKFLKEAFSETEKVNVNHISFKCLILLAVATSIDAFGAGVSLKFSGNSVILPALLIGIVTFVLSAAGFLTASCLKNFPEKFIKISGAMLLFYLAVKSVL